MTDWTKRSNAPSTSWTEKSAAPSTSWSEKSAAPGTVWSEKSDAPATSWSERSAASAIEWLTQLTIKKQPNNFYRGFYGILNAKVPSKESSNFYHLAGASDGAGDFLLGRTVKNFVRLETR